MCKGYTVKHKSRARVIAWDRTQFDLLHPSQQQQETERGGQRGGEDREK